MPAKNKTNKQIANLQRQVANLKVTAPKKRSNGRRQRGNVPNMSPRGIPNQVAQNNKRAPRMSSNKQGHTMLNFAEPWVEVEQGSGTAKFAPGFGTPAFLNSVASRYDQYRLVSCGVEYRTACGTTTAGDIVMGIDYNTKTTNTSFAAVSVLQPHWAGAVWTNGNLRVGISEAMKGMLWRQTRNDDPDAASAFQLAWNCTTAQTGMVGRIWIHYKVELSTPLAPGSASGGLVGISNAVVVASGDATALLAAQGDVVVSEGAPREVTQFVTLVNGPIEGGSQIIPGEPFTVRAAVKTPTLYTVSHGLGGLLQTPPTLRFVDANGDPQNQYFKVSSPTFASAEDGYGGFWSWVGQLLADVAIELLAEVICAVILDTGTYNEAQSGLLELSVYNGPPPPAILYKNLQVDNYALQTGPLFMGGLRYGQGTAFDQKAHFIYPAFSVTTSVAGGALLFTLTIPSSADDAMRRGVIIVYGTSWNGTTLIENPQSTQGVAAPTALGALTIDNVYDLGYNGRAGSSIKLFRYKPASDPLNKTIVFRAPANLTSGLYSNFVVGFEVIDI